MFDTGVSIGEYAGGANAKFVKIGTATFWFSYETCIAFEDDKGFVASENIAGTTMGRHLNTIARYKEDRLPWEEFTAKLQSCLKRHKLAG